MIHDDWPSAGFREAGHYGRTIQRLQAENARLADDLAFQSQNAADAHQERANQFRRAADALETLAEMVESYDLVLTMVPPVTAGVIRGAFVLTVPRARALVMGESPDVS